MAISPRYYYMLYTVQDDGTYAPQFGDTSRKVVEQERRDTYAGERFRIEAFFGMPTEAQVRGRAAMLARYSR